eukprot:Protomagalhaensia_sp_Gyna_25__2814@NODE_262_length_4139_cov_252_860488_g203_i0_p1_GENE_NODE_262_length_4139_cov_252_860488_g203_i0NODE_262_length_4139_cov_252_860488_g203_i0_p1_ORF_typecomplete_len643_score116_14Ribophorin_II/PF05817_14/0_019_NODE_262_length_4139_cov_252_860488_g203_i018713799
MGWLQTGILAALLTALASTTETRVNARVKAGNVRESARLLTKILRTWNTRQFKPELAPLALYAAGGARDEGQRCRMIETVASETFKQKSAVTLDALDALLTLANLTACDSPSLQFKPSLHEEQLTSVRHGHGLGTALRQVPPDRLNLTQWQVFTSNWKALMKATVPKSLEVYDDLLGLINAESFLTRRSEERSPALPLESLVMVVRDPILNLLLLQDPDAVARARTIEAFARTYEAIATDFPEDTLKPEEMKLFRFVRLAAIHLAEELIRTLSTERPGTFGPSQLSYLITALWRLENTGLLYLVSDKSGDSLDILVSRPLKRWDLGLSLRFQDPKDALYWSITTEDSLSYTLQRKPQDSDEGDEPYPEPLQLSIVNEKNVTVASYRPGSPPAEHEIPLIPLEVYLASDTYELVTASEIQVSLNKTGSMCLMRSNPHDKRHHQLSICNENGAECMAVSMAVGRFGFQMAEVDLKRLGSQRFTVKDASADPHRVITVSIEDIHTTMKPMKSAIVHESESRWILTTELDYTFPADIPDTQYVAAAVFTAGVWIIPSLLVMLLLGPSSKSITSSWIRLNQPSLRASYGLVAIYAVSLNAGLVYYWAAWKLIPFSRVLVTLVVLGSIVLSVVLTDFEARHHRSKKQD